MLAFENNIIVGYGYLRNENEILVNGKNLTIKNLNKCQPFYSNSIFFIGRKENDEIILLEVDDLPLENTISEIGTNFLPIIEIGEVIASVIMTRKCNFISSQGMNYIEMKTNDANIQAYVPIMDENEFKNLENDDYILLTSDNVYVDKRSKTLFFQNTKILPIIL